MDFWEFYDKNFWQVTLGAIPLLSFFVTLSAYLILIFTEKLNLKLKYKGIELSKHDTNKNKNNKIVDYALRDVVAYAQLSQLCTYFSADITCVFQLHNGGSYYNGISVQRWTLSHDYAKDNVTSFYEKNLKFKDQLISQAMDWIGETIINKFMFIKVSEMPRTSSWRREFVRNGIDCMLLQSIENDTNSEMVIGVFFRRLLEEEQIEINSSIFSEYCDKLSATLKNVSQEGKQT